MLFPLIYKPDPEKDGYVVLDRMWTYEELKRVLVFVLKREGLYDDLDYFDTGIGIKYVPNASEDIPEGLNCIVAYAVEGTSEGHYIHVDFHGKDCPGTAFLAKTFLGWEHALKVSNVLASVFYSPLEQYHFKEPMKVESKAMEAA